MFFKKLFCNHNLEYDGDTVDGKYYICSKCNKEKFISHNEFSYLTDYQKKYWKTRMWTIDALKTLINKNINNE